MAEPTMLVLCDGAAVAELGGDGPVRRLERLWVQPERRRQGLGRRALGLVTDRMAAEGVRVLSAVVPADDPAATALASGSRRLGEHLEKPVDPDVVPPAALGWRALAPDEFEVWAQTQVRAYAEDNLERSGGDAELALERSRADFARLLPDGQQTPDTTLVALTADGARVGHLWLRHHQAPGLTYVFDVEVELAHRGRGLGRAAMVLADWFAHDAGDTRIGLHVFGGNEPARRLYRSEGYLLVSTTYDLLAPD